MDIQLNDPNNFGCILRDLIWKNIDSFKREKNESIEMSLIKERLDRISIPEKYWDDILKMCEYRICERCTDPIEQLIERIVLKGILNKIVDEEDIN